MLSSDQIFRSFVAGKMSPFYDRYYPAMLMYATRLLGEGLEWMAEDCVQDAVFDSFEKRHSFGSCGQWLAHMKACIRNKAVSALRKLSAMRNYMSDCGRSDLTEGDVTRAIIENEVLDALHAAIRRLPDEYRTLLHMSFAEGLKNSEIARRLGVAEITVKKRKARMLEMLRVSMGGDIDTLTLSLLLMRVMWSASNS